ncbi:MAG TPA: CHAD domain-containing protein [Caulobacteraceae bacterium]|jgi:CHAD domain-containing protein|nr:CHAD domain-containing protein [Caulobacteraceae bacterium]
MTRAEAMQAIGRACLERFVTQAQIIVEARAPEGVHQARVATRRLRAGMSLFKPILADPQSRRVNGDLWTIAAELGKARDLDVMLKRVRELEFPGAVDTSPLIARLEEDREQAYENAVSMLEPSRLDPIVLETTTWVERGDWLNGADKDQAKARARRVEGVAEDELDRRTRALRKSLKNLDHLDDAERHRVRIKAKKVRYGAEFFTPLAPGKSGQKAAKAFVGALKPLQDCLGGLNDIVTSGRMLRDVSRASAVAGFAAGAAADEIERTKDDLLHGATKAAEDFMQAKTFLD